MNALSPSSALSFPLADIYFWLALKTRIYEGGELDGSVSEIKPIITIQYALEMYRVHET